MPLTDAKDSGYGKRLRWLNDHLSSCNIQDYIDTPTISIIGSQSTGKSSVLEALSGIAFPRASGTCTRCPTEVRLFNASGEWSCKVTLRIDRDAKNQLLEKPRIQMFGPTITNKAEVQERIQAAQCAILNPDKDPLSFIGTKIDPNQTIENQISFSENTICLDIRGNDLIDLSLVDLPGIIATTAGAEDDQSVDLIKDLVKKRISKPGCLILMTITMTDDYQNQVAVRFAKDADPDQKRTLGVLTKPDLVQEADLGEWLKIIEGKKFQLLHGHYVLRNANSSELQKKDWNHEAARTQEEAYFKKEPWYSLGILTNQRLGSKQLGKQLEKHLETLIKDKLPETIEKVRTLSEETNEELAKLPKEISEAASLQHLHILLQNLSVDVQNTLRGDLQPKTFVLPLKLLAILFRQKIYASRPVFRPFTKDEDEEGKRTERSSNDEGNNKNGECEVNDNQKKERDDIFDDEELASDYKAASKSKPEDNDGKLQNLIENGEIYKMKVSQYELDLSTIQSVLNDSSLERLPGNVCWEIKERMIKEAIKSLPAFSTNLLKDTVALLKTTVKQIVQQHLQSFSNSPICGRVTEIMLDLIEEEGRKCSTILNAINQCEMNHIYSMNEHYYCDKVNIYRERAIRKRQKVTESHLITLNQTPNQVSNTLQSRNGMTQAPNQAIIKPKVDANYHADANISQLIQIASEIRAYWQVAFKRFTDYVRSIIEVQLIKPVGKLCLDRLCEAIGIYGSINTTKAHALLREADDVRLKRADLQSRKERLDKALTYIAKFQNGDFDDI